MQRKGGLTTFLGPLPWPLVTVYYQCWTSIYSVLYTVARKDFLNPKIKSNIALDMTTIAI